MRSAVKKGGAADRPDIGGFVAIASSTALCALKTSSSPPTLELSSQR
jgi:hypothetical protein